MEAITWRPSGVTTLAIAASAVPVFVAGLFLFGLPVALFGGRGTYRIEIGLVELAGALALIVILALLHESIHGLVMWRFGAHPRFGAALLGKTTPVLYAAAPGHFFTRTQYLVVATAPATVISVAGLVACAGPPGIYLVVPLAAHLAACMGDAAATWQLLRQPRGTMVEDLIDGLRFHRPPDPTR